MSIEIRLRLPRGRLGEGLATTTAVAAGIQTAEATPPVAILAVAAAAGTVAAKEKGEVDCVSKAHLSDL